MGRDGRIVNHKPKNLKAQIEKEIIEEFFYVEKLEEIEGDIKTPPNIIEEEKVIEPIVIVEIEHTEDERVICINTNMIYENNKVASEQTGINSGAIKRCCNGDTKSAGKDENGKKLVWKYVRDL